MILFEIYYKSIKKEKGYESEFDYNFYLKIQQIT